MSGGSGFNPSPEQLQAIIDTGIWWNHKVQELRDAERFEDAYGKLYTYKKSDLDYDLNRKWLVVEVASGSCAPCALAAALTEAQMKHM